jgi:hypothetical protein
VLASAIDRITREVPAGALVLDVGGWAAPFARADWVLDAQPWETRGAEGRRGRGRERFSRATWVVRDPCERRPWPFDDGELELAVCVDTLAVVRDPVWVCAELSRVARAGYVEVPTLEAELTFGVQGPWLGREEHRWLVDVVDGELVFTVKTAGLHDDRRLRVPRRAEPPAEGDGTLGIFWEGELLARERLLAGAAGHAALREELVARARAASTPTEAALREVREGARQAASRAADPARRAADRALRRLRKD